MDEATRSTTCQNLAALGKEFQSYRQIYVQELGYSAQWFDAASALVNRITQAIKQGGDDALGECFTQNRRLLLEINEAGNRYDRLPPDRHFPHDVYTLGWDIGFLYSEFASKDERRIFNALQQLALSDDERTAIVEAIRHYSAQKDAPQDEWEIQKFSSALDALSQAAGTALVEFKDALSDEHRCDLICRDTPKYLQALQSLHTDDLKAVYDMMTEYATELLIAEPHTLAIMKFVNLQHRVDELFPALRQRGK